MALRTFESERDALVAYVHTHRHTHTHSRMVTFKCASDFRFARLFFSFQFNVSIFTRTHTPLSLSPFWCFVCLCVLFMFVWDWSYEEFLDLFSIPSRLRKSIFHFLCSLLFKSAFQIWHISELGKLHGSKLEANERRRMKKISHWQQMLFDFLTKQINRIVWYLLLFFLCAWQQLCRAHTCALLSEGIFPYPTNESLTFLIIKNACQIIWFKCKQ